MTEHTTLRLPAEWEPQDAVLLAWPHPDTDWAGRLDSVEATYRALVAALVRFEPAVVVVADPELGTRVRDLLAADGVDLDRVRLVEAPYDDTWLRDSGPITLRGPGATELLDFRFTGWGGKFAASRDDELVSRLHQAGLFGRARHRRIDFALEGGAIEVDGEGTVLTTWQCLEHRHPDLDREQIASVLRDSLNQRRVLSLEHGYLQGDDTDAHIDTLARFASPRDIVHQACDDPADSHHAELGAMAGELAALRDAEGQPYRLHALPWPQPILDDGRRLAASYANYLVVNGAVLMPAYDDPADQRAREVLAAAYPGREIVPLPCRALIWQNGSLHCITMQLPEGTLDAA